MDYPLRWEGLQRSIVISNAMLPQSRREGPLGVVEATRRLPNPSPGGWQCALPAASRLQCRMAGATGHGLAWGDGQQTPAASSGGAAVSDWGTREGSASALRSGCRVRCWVKREGLRICCQRLRASRGG